MSIEYQLPQLPLGGPEATLVRWLKQPGDRLAPGDPLLVVANDSVEVVFPISTEGAVEALLVAEGAPVTASASLPDNRRKREPWETFLLAALVIGVVVAALWALVANGVFGPGL